MQRLTLTVGGAGADIAGFTNLHIQCAVDHVAAMGGGDVMLTGGTFTMADSLHLRSNVRVAGQGDKTVLRKSAMKRAKIVAYLGYGHNDLVLDAPDTFEIGEGVYIHDDRSHGFYTTVATLVARENDTWFINQRHHHDYNAAANGVVETLFPLVSAVDAPDARLENVAVDGNAAENGWLNGCRGGGVFALRSNRLHLAGVLVRNGNFDGISFQTCDDVEVRDCLVEECRGHGFHPGSGSNRFHIHHCTARRNGACGLFYCLRVRDSLVEDCRFEENGAAGLSIGGRDIGHVNRRLVIRGNGGPGVLLRPGAFNDAPHRNTIEACTIEDNGRAKGEAEVLLDGETDGTRLLANTITAGAGRPGILIRLPVREVEMRDNRVKGAVIDERARPV